MTYLSLWLNVHFDILFIDANMYWPFKFVISPFNWIFQSIKNPAPRYCLHSVNLAGDPEVWFSGPGCFLPLSFKLIRKCRGWLEFAVNTVDRHLCWNTLKEGSLENVFHRTRDFCFLGYWSSWYLETRATSHLWSNLSWNLNSHVYGMDLWHR